MLNRRCFLQTGLTGTVLVSSIGRFAWTETVNDARLVLMILRGGMDGLAAVPAYGEPQFAQLRGTLALPGPRAGNGTFDLDGFFGLHPALDQLYSLFKQNELIIFQGVASPYRERSHFDGQNLLENGTNRPSGAEDGWLNRALLEITRNQSSNSEYAIAISQSIPLILNGKHPVNSWSPSSLPEADETLIARIAEMYSDDHFFSSQLSSAIATRNFAETTGNDAMSQTAGMRGRNAQLASQARAAGKFLSSPEGPRIAVLESNGWDTHANQTGQLANQLSFLDDAIAALKAASGTTWNKTVVLIVTEFGRTVAVNGTGGTDHGTAGAAFMAGGAVNGGKVLTDWRGLAKSSLYEGRDLYPTMDLRTIFKSVLHDHLQVSTAALESAIFPQSETATFIPDLIRG